MIPQKKNLESVRFQHYLRVPFFILYYIADMENSYLGYEHVMIIDILSNHICPSTSNRDRGFWWE